uniref:Synaptobrevin, longin-like domain protein n=1 Tax=Tanacetum cinerariifolium TaxID=118510 RepID=A0A6L2LXU1_TANCI|nr:hypothetical protein [Tanacetum cinerariifolium]
MVAILEKSEHNVDFHPIVDFLEASHLRYALTFKPTVYVSHIRQFWSTARIETTKERTKILATIDGSLRTIFESSIRRNLKLNDEVGISSLPDAELFKNLTLMGYNISPNQKFTFQKGQFSHQWKYLIHTIMQCLSPKSTGFNEFSSNIATTLGKGSGTPTKSHHTPSPEAEQPSPTTHSSSSLPPITTATIPPVIPTESLPIVILSDNPLSGNTPGELGLLSPYDSTPRVTSLTADEGSMQHKLDELMALCTSLQRQQSKMVFMFKAQELEINRLKARIKLLEDKNRGVADQSGDDAPIKRKRLDEGEEAAERVSDDKEEIETILTSIDAASILTSGGIQVVPTAVEVATATVSIPTGSGVVSTASPSIPTDALIFATATIVTPYTRRKGKEKMLEEEMERDTQRMNKQIARDTEIARIHAEEELQILINSLDRSNESVLKYLQEYKQFAKDLSIEERVELITSSDKISRKLCLNSQIPDSTKNAMIENFIPMGSKEEAVRFKRKRIRFEQEGVKKMKTSEEVPKEVKSSEEVPKDKVKEMMQLVPVEELYDTCGVHHVTSKDKEIFMLVEKDYPLRNGLAIIMICYKLQVENYSQVANDLILKIYKIANYPSIPTASYGVPTASEESSHCQKKGDATVVKIAMLLKSRSNYQSTTQSQGSTVM